jgi:hypothetical protein
LPRGRRQGGNQAHTKIQGKSVLVRGLTVLASAISTPRGAVRVMPPSRSH